MNRQWNVYFLSLPRSTSWSPDAVLREGVMQCCMRRWRSTSSEGQQTRYQDGKNCPWKKEEEKWGFGTGITALSTISLHYQQITTTVTGAVQTLWNTIKNRLPLKARYFLFFTEMFTKYPVLSTISIDNQAILLTGLFWAPSRIISKVIWEL